MFTCLNPECGKESCRICKEISHIPLRCEEVEKDVEVRKRTYIENKMAEALIRTCYKCKRPYVKQVNHNFLDIEIHKYTHAGLLLNSQMSIMRRII